MDGRRRARSARAGDLPAGGAETDAGQSDAGGIDSGEVDAGGSLDALTDARSATLTPQRYRLAGPPLPVPGPTIRTAPDYPDYTRDEEALRAAMARDAEFVERYLAARERWLAGDRDVLWPAGTYAMRRRHRVRCADPPS